MLARPLPCRKKIMAHFRTEEEMFPLVAQWHESGQTQKAFCIQHSIPVSIFAYWLRRYRDQQDSTEDKQSNFVPVRCDPVRMDVSSPAALEVALPSGAVLRFAQVVPVGYLKSLL